MLGGIVILRVISGSVKGHLLKTVKGNSTRPTTDRVKESLFNIISGFIPGSSVLDLFAGTGSLGIESLSRGAENAVFVDKSRDSIAVIKANLEHTKLADRTKVYNLDAYDILLKLSNSGEKFDIIFMDPPYKKAIIPEALKLISQKHILSDDGIIVTEHHISDELPESLDDLSIYDTRKYGETVLSLYKKI